MTPELTTHYNHQILTAILSMVACFLIALSSLGWISRDTKSGEEGMSRTLAGMILLAICALGGIFAFCVFAYSLVRVLL